MPDIAIFHPQIVHFAVVLCFVGVGLRLFSLTGGLPWTNQAAALVLLGAAASGFVAARSGTQAHRVPESIPGAAEAVQEHEEWGERARTALLIVGALELVGLLLSTGRGGQIVRIGAAAAGIAAAVAVFEAGEHGGELVYSYAGGVGTRSGDSTDVRHLLVAGLYHQAQAARKAGRPDEAARLTEELGRQMPGDQGVAFLLLESQLEDRKNPAAVRAALAAMPTPPDSMPRAAIRQGLLLARVYTALGAGDSATALLASLSQRFPQSQSVKAAVNSRR